MSTHTLITRLVTLAILVGVAVSMIGPMTPMTPMTPMAPMVPVVISADSGAGLHPTVLVNDVHDDRSGLEQTHPGEDTAAVVNLAELSPACADGTSHCSKNCNRLDFAALVFTRATDGRLKLLPRPAKPPVVVADLAPKFYDYMLASQVSAMKALQIDHGQASAPFKTVFARTSRFLS